MEAGLDDRARFVEANVYDVPDALARGSAVRSFRDAPPRAFSLVSTSYGVPTWLPDVERWAGVVADCLAPGGTFYVAEITPSATS